jgi:hypothetical protein
MLGNGPCLVNLNTNYYTRLPFEQCEPERLYGFRTEDDDTSRFVRLLTYTSQNKAMLNSPRVSHHIIRRRPINPTSNSKQHTEVGTGDATWTKKSC